MCVCACVIMCVYKTVVRLGVQPIAAYHIYLRTETTTTHLLAGL